jgi:cytochrome b
VTLRIVWGFIGPRHARFADFVRAPREVLAYFRDGLLLRAQRYIGHNPAGGPMVVTLLVILAATCVSQYLMTTDAYWGSKAYRERPRNDEWCPDGCTANLASLHAKFYN